MVCKSTYCVNNIKGVNKIYDVNKTFGMNKAHYENNMPGASK